MISSVFDGFQKHKDKIILLNLETSFFGRFFFDKLKKRILMHILSMRRFFLLIFHYDDYFFHQKLIFFEKKTIDPRKLQIFS